MFMIICEYNKLYYLFVFQDTKTDSFQHREKSLIKVHGEIR